jgi:hypothetical protein
VYDILDTVFKDISSLFVRAGLVSNCAIQAVPNFLEGWLAAGREAYQVRQHTGRQLDRRALVVRIRRLVLRHGAGPRRGSVAYAILGYLRVV